MKIKKPIALQLYSLKRDLEKDFFGSIKKVAEIGYNGVEFAGFFGHSAEEVKKALDEYNLKAVSVHTNLHYLTQNYDKELAFYKTLDCHYAVIAWADDDHSPNGKYFEEQLKNYENMGRRLKKEGIELLYHNHEFEFVDYKGTVGFDYMFQNTSSEYFNPEIDVCWVKVAGYDPVDYIRKFNGRVKLVHLKDFAKEVVMDEKTNEKKEILTFTPVGKGGVNIPEIIKAGEDGIVEWYIVEQDQNEFTQSFDDAKSSLDYLKSLEI